MEERALLAGLEVEGAVAGEVQMPGEMAGVDPTADRMRLIQQQREEPQQVVPVGMGVLVLFPEHLCSEQVIIINYKDLPEERVAVVEQLLVVIVGQVEEVLVFLFPALPMILVLFYLLMVGLGKMVREQIEVEVEEALVVY
jgi:hypothetical protein